MLSGYMRLLKIHPNYPAKIVFLFGLFRTKGGENTQIKTNDAILQPLLERDCGGQESRL